MSVRGKKPGIPRMAAPYRWSSRNGSEVFFVVMPLPAAGDGSLIAIWHANRLEFRDSSIVLTIELSDNILQVFPEVLLI